ncbi:hypothetical protein [Kitasatospora griseola]|uniref:hypothetical protein n=1 Tax=Kitasatospora griseola TaxID=2064 RepID=UPI003431319A
MGQGDPTDAEWERLRPFLLVGNRRCGRWRDHRQRPPAQRIARHKKRNTVERAIGKLKNSRAVAAWCDKRGCVFLGTVTVAALII